jgi:twitching motility protein PilT
MARIDSFLHLVTEQNASDLHFASGTVPTIRFSGELLPLPFRRLGESEARRFLLEILSEEQKQELARRLELDFVYAIPGVGRFRANYFHQTNGIAAVFRIIPATIPSIQELGLPEVLSRFADWSNGLVLVTGPTGAGKSTTLAAILNELNEKRDRHIITVEDPIEYLHECKKSVVTQRQVGEHALSFAQALRSALRESPDVLVVGEMRDLETISLALQAAETGVLVFGTLHTDSAAKAIDRVIDALPEGARDQTRGLLSVLLRAVVSQILVRTATGEGRACVYEVLLQNWAISNLIRESKVHQIDGVLMTAEAIEAGMVHMDTCLERYVRDGTISLDTALRVARYPDELRKATGDVREAA